VTDAKTYTLVTVVHRADYPLLRLQARSLGRYLLPGLSDEIWVIANQGLQRLSNWQEPLLQDYGSLADRVRFLDAVDVAAIPPATTGWASQQILKLMVANLVTSDHYVVLDAKNHLVFPLQLEFFEVGSKLRSTQRNYRGHPMRGSLEGSLRYFDIEEHQLIGSFLPTITPFVFPTHLVRTLVDTVAERERCQFPASFESLGTTEFLLFGAYLCSLPGGIEEVYDLSNHACPVVWTSTAAQGFEGVEPVVARVRDERLPFFTIHRHAFPLLDQRSREAVAALWSSRHFFDSAAEGLRFLDNLDL
jgi:Family of unknown function (DUF6492)